METIQNFLVRMGSNTSIEELTLDGSLHYLDEKEGFKGWYRGSITKFGSRLQMGDWRGKKDEYFAPATAPVDEKEREAWEKERKQKEVEEAVLQEEIQNQKAKHVQEILQTFSKEGESTYLKNKGVLGYGIFYRFPSASSAKETDLIIPIQDIDNKIWNYQVISPSGDKDFLPGAKVGCCFHLIGEEPKKVVYITEGYATAASVFMATEKPTVCAFFAGNIPKVAKAFRIKYPKIKIVIAADNDETGLRFARQAETESKAFVASVPKLEGELDFNDYFKLKGKLETQKLLIGAAIEPKNRGCLIEAEDLVEEPEEAINYIVQDLFPVGGTSLIAGQPKIGKTTLMRHLLSSISAGTPFLARKTIPGRIIYIGLEEKRSFFTQKLRKMKKEQLKNIRAVFRLSPTDKFPEITEYIEEFKPSIIVIDTLYKFIKVKDDNYAEIVALMQPIEMLARDWGVHICLVHHAKKGESEGIDSVLGSTGIAASVDTIITIKRQKISGTEERVISSDNRYGEDIPKSILSYNRETEECNIEGKVIKKDPELERKEKVLQAFKEKSSEWLSPTQMREIVKGEKQKIKEACEALYSEGALEHKPGNTTGELYRINPSYMGAVDQEDKF